MKKLFLLAGSGLVAVVLLGFSYYQNFLSKVPDSQGQEVVYEVQPLIKGVAPLIHDLKEKNLITDEEMFYWFIRLKGAAKKIKVGEYAFKTDMTPNEVLNVLTSGKSLARRWTISEGLNIFEIAQSFEKDHIGKAADFLAYVRNPVTVKKLLGSPDPIDKKIVSLEGYLFPETYLVTKYTTLETLVSQMVHNFMKTYEEVIRQHAAELQQGEAKGWSRHQIVTLASIIEKETGAPEERPLISSVFHNRIHKKMLLQTDPTIIYGMSVERNQLVDKISKADILRPTEYNTYVISGLPPGPITNPGREAIRAVIKPATSSYLFFVSQNNGTHAFSDTYEQHSQSVKRFQIDSKAREGKSWRDLKKDRAGENLQQNRK